MSSRRPDRKRPTQVSSAARYRQKLLSYFTVFLEGADSRTEIQSNVLTTGGVSMIGRSISRTLGNASRSYLCASSRVSHREMIETNLGSSSEIIVQWSTNPLCCFTIIE